MIIKTLYLRHFRSYQEAFFEFCPHFNVIQGANARGKTTILEAIHYLMLGRSFRSPQSQELIKEGCDHFYIEAHFSKHGVDQSIKIGFDGKEKKLIYNHTPLPSAAGLLGIVQGVIMSPDDINLVKGTPQLRRQFLDIQLAQVDPLYVHHLTRYARATKQRNQLLKARQSVSIETWEHEMSQSSAYLSWRRRETVNDLTKRSSATYLGLTKEDVPIDIHYQTHFPNSDVQQLREYHLGQLKKYREREMMIGYTLTGPHKDDLGFIMKDNHLRHFGSEGQQRSFVTAVRLAEWDRLNQIAQDLPLLMIDDVGISLDQMRRQNLMNLLSNGAQIFLTTTDENLYDQINANKKIFSL